MNKREEYENITVAVRVRPLDAEEKRQKATRIIDQITRDEISIRDRQYKFQHVFNENASQSEIYSILVSPLIPDVVAGYNCTIFSYGQTGLPDPLITAGNNSDLPKIHRSNVVAETIYDTQAGIISRVVARIFLELRCRRMMEYDIRVSFLELYNEEVRDLLSDHQLAPPLNIVNDCKGFLCIQNLKEISVSNICEVHKLLEEGVSRRKTWATNITNRISRSHAIFTITVYTREVNASGLETFKTGNLNLIDLAGSENAIRPEDMQPMESKNMNKSLLALGQVIHLLSERKARNQVPYGNSKLTRILQDSLGGCTKTKMIATISSSQKYYGETLRNLEYALRVKNIRNTPLVNERVTKAHIMQKMNREIERLKRELEITRRSYGEQGRSESLDLRIEQINSKIQDMVAIKEMKDRAFTTTMDACKKKGQFFEKNASTWASE